MGFTPESTPKVLKRISWLGLPTPEQEQRARRTFVIAQIDGLSEANMQRALRAGKLPYLAKLLREKKMAVGPWRALIPTSTAAFQVGLFYGHYDRIPGFFWYGRDKGRRIRMNSSEDTAHVEEEVLKWVAPYRGLLSGGSSYSALFTGGADNTFLTFSRLFSPRLNLSTKSRWIYLFFLSQIFLVLRIVYYSIIEIGISLYDLFKSFFSRHSPFAEFKFLFPRIASVVFCREIATLAAILDIYRGAGPVYLNYFSYDEHAHHRGPNSRYAFWSLKGLDASIRRIWKTMERARKMGIRDYDLIVLSDHGQIRTHPFYEVFGQTPHRHFDLLFRALHGGVSGAVVPYKVRAGEKIRPLRRRDRKRTSPDLLERQLQRTEDILPAFIGLRAVFRFLMRWANRALVREEKLHGIDPQRRVEFVTTGPVGHVCLADRETPVPFEEWQERFPRFLDVLAQHDGIGFVLCRTRAGGCRVGSQGKWMDIGDDSALAHSCTAAAAETIHTNREQLLKLANMDWAGDFIVFGYGRADHKVISYSFERGGHAGPSPEETTPFIMVPAGQEQHWPELSGFDRKHLLTLRQLHERLQAIYCGEILADRHTGAA